MPKKKISTFLDLELKEDKDLKEIFKVLKPSIEEANVKELIKKKKKIWEVVCPYCGLRRVIFKKKIFPLKIKSERSLYYNPNKEVRFDLYNYKEEPFIAVKVALPSSFPEVLGISINELIENLDKLPPSIREVVLDLLRQLKKRSKEILDYLESIGI